MILRRVERQIYVGREDFDELCFKAKNLYNKANYVIRQKFFETTKEREAGLRKNAVWIRYEDVDRLAKAEEWEEYRALPAQTSQQILKVLDQNWKSFFQAIKVWGKNPNAFTGRPKLPQYKDKSTGRSVVIFTNQGCRIKDGFIHFPKSTGLSPIKTNVIPNELQQVRITPKSNCFILEVAYKREFNPLGNLNESVYVGIDIGLNNLVTLGSNDTQVNPIIISGGPVKSINQYYNKKRAKLQSSLGDSKTSNRIEKLALKRNNKIDDYMHKVSRFVVDYCIANKVGTIVIGKNDGWKQNINIGKRNNQNFVSIPFAKLISQIQYKAEEIGIKVICNEESYTSKCSFLDNESIGKHEIYHGKRVKRGLFRSALNVLINADLNGALNVIRKAIPNAFANGIEGVRLHPFKVSI